jgi:hypothetical protein
MKKLVELIPEYVQFRVLQLYLHEVEMLFKLKHTDVHMHVICSGGRPWKGQPGREGGRRGRRSSRN